MPIYEYACNACEHRFEEWQKMSDPPVLVCPKCKKKKVERLISQTAFQLKGGGWYADLYSSSKPDKGGSSDSANKESSKDGASSDGGKGTSAKDSTGNGGSGGGKDSPSPAKDSSKSNSSKAAPSGKKESKNSPKKAETRAA